MNPTRVRRAAWTLCSLALFAGWTTRAVHPQQQDPLTDKDVDQVRDARDRPDERIKLYTKFIDQRVAAIKDLTGKSHLAAGERSTQLRDKFEEFTRLADELSDNLETYGSEHADIRKSLKDLVASSERWQPVLNAPSTDTVYDFSRKTAVEAAESTSDQAKKLQEEQEKYFAEHKDQRGKNGTGPD